MLHLILFFVFLFFQTLLFAQTTEKTSDLVLVPQSGHTGAITSISITEDNQYYLTVGTRDGQAHLRNAEGEKIRSFMSANGNTVYSVLSPNGKYLVTVGLGSSELWDIDGNLIKKFSPNANYSDSFKKVKFSTDSSQFLISGLDENLHLYDTKGNLIHKFLNTKSANNFEFSSDSKNILIGNYYKGTLEFLTLDGSIQKTIKAYTTGFDHFQIVATQSKIVTLGNDLKEGISIKLWDMNGNLIKIIYKMKGSNQSYPLDISADGKIIALPVVSIGVILIDFDGNEIKMLKDVVSPTAVAFSKDGQTILVGNSEGNIFRYSGVGDFIEKELNTSKEIFSFDYMQNSILLNGSKILNLYSNQTEKISTVDRYGKFTKDNQYIVLMEEDKLILFDKTKKKKPRTLFTETFPSNSLFSISNNNHILMSDQSDKQIKILNLEGKILNSLDRIQDNDTYSILSPNGKQILTVSNKYFLRLKDLSGKSIFTLTGRSSDEIFKLSFSSTGKYIFVSLEYDVEVYDTSGKLLFSLPKTYRAETISSGDEKFFLTGDFFGSICIWNSDGKKQKCFLSNGGSIKSLTLSEKNQFIISASDDGLIRYYNFNDPKLVLTVLSTDLGIIAICPDGRFDYEDNRALRYLFFRKSKTNELISLDQVFQSYYTPDLFKKIRNGTLPNSNVDVSSALKKNLPELKLDLGPQNSGRIDLNVEACDKGGGLQNIAVYQNGNLIHEENYSPLTQQGSCKVGTVTLNLAAGQNAFKISAYNSANIKAESPTRAVTYVSPESLKPQLHVLMVAINEYVSESSKLKFAVKDAEGLKESLEKYGKGAFGKVNFYEVYNSEAVKSGILKALKKVKDKAQLNDTVVVFFSGHGFTVDGKFFYIPQDITNDKHIKANSEAEYNQKHKEWEVYVKKGSISSDEISQSITQIKSNNKMLIIDSCYSGGGWLSKVNEAKVDQKIEEQRSDMVKKSNLTGIAMISAAQDFQKANENGDVGHGFLTFGLLEAMKIEKDRGKITAFSVIPQAAKKVRELSLQYKKKQVPFQSTSGVDFELSD